MRKKLLCTVSAVAMLAGLFVVGTALPAQAVPPNNTQNFYPDDTPKSDSDGLRLSDRFDGVDTAVHLTNVSTADTTRVQWRLCPSSTVPDPLTTDTSTLTQDEFDSCTIVIGEDSSPTTPVGNAVSTVDEAYEFNWDIPGSEDGQTRDLVAAACIGAGEDVEDDTPPAGDERNCALDVENDVLLDDAQTATPQTSSGEMVSICTTDVGGPASGDDPCNDPTPGDNTIDPDVAALYTTFVHGDNVPNDGFTMRARTSDDITGTRAVINLGDATTDPNTPADADSGACTLIFTGTNFKEWECEFAAGPVPNDAEFAVTLIRTAGGAGNCAATNCEFDSHYVVSDERHAQEARVFFDPAGNGGPPDPEDVNDDSSCDTPDKEDTNRVGDDTPIRGCILDQFGDPFDTQVTFESSGVGDFDSCGGGLLHDHDGDGEAEHCHHDSGGPDAEASAELRSTVPGDQTITFCFDPENGGATPNPPPADHGCDDETVVDTLVKHWIAGLPAHIHLVYAGTGTAGNPCHTGDNFRQNLVGDRDDLLACVFDGFDNPSTTNQTDGGFLEWQIDPGTDDEVDTQYVGTPPSETGSDARATATIEAINPGSDDPFVCLRDDDSGVCFSQDGVTKNVTGFPPDRADSNISIRHRGRPHRFVGRVTSPDDSCESGRRVTVRRQRRGRDPVIGRDTTSGNGRYVVRHRRTNRRFRYYAQVRQNPDCTGATSRRTGRVR